MLFSKKRLFLSMIVLVSVWLVLSSFAGALTISEEEKLGKNFLKYVQNRYRFADDRFCNIYINRLGKRLAAAFPNQVFDFRFFIIQDDTYNAFAAPAGYVFVNTGLINAMTSEDELAGIMAHEIAHVYCRHISKKIEQSKKIGLATLAGMAAGVLLGAGGVIPGDAVAIGSAAAGQAASLAYSREDERQADQIGVTYLCRAGYSPAGLLSMLKKIKSKEWFSKKDFPTYLSTHPGTDERIMYIDSIMSSHAVGPCKKRGRHSGSDAFPVFLARIKALYTDEDSALSHFSAGVKQNPGSMIDRYGYGLVLCRKNRTAEAIDQFRKILDTEPFNIHALMALGETYYLAGNYKKAMAILQNVSPGGFYGTKRNFLLAMAADRLGMKKKALVLFRQVVRDSPGDLPAIYGLGKTSGEVGNLEDAHFYLGIYYSRRGDIKNALFHLQKALELAKEDKRKDRINSIMSELESRRKKQH